MHVYSGHRLHSVRSRIIDISFSVQLSEEDEEFNFPSVMNTFSAHKTLHQDCPHSLECFHLDHTRQNVLPDIIRPSVTQAAKDPILGISENFLADPHPDKINLGVVS